MEVLTALDVVFGTNAAMTGWQECARAVLVFGYGLLLVRVSGRRVFSRWSAIDVIVSIVAGASLGRAMTGGAPLWGTMAAVTLLMILHGVVAWASARSERWSRILEGRAIPLARDGMVKPSALRRHFVSHADLEEALRQRGIEATSETRLVILEPSGQITVLGARS